MRYYERRTSYYEIGGHICESDVPEPSASRSVSSATPIHIKSDSRGTGGRSTASSTPSQSMTILPYSYGNPAIWLASNLLMRTLAPAAERKKMEITGELPYD